MFNYMTTKTQGRLVTTGLTRRLILCSRLHLYCLFSSPNSPLPASPLASIFLPLLTSSKPLHCEKEQNRSTNKNLIRQKENAEDNIIKDQHILTTDCHYTSIPRHCCYQQHYCHSHH